MAIQPVHEPATVAQSMDVRAAVVGLIRAGSDQPQHSNSTLGASFLVWLFAIITFLCVPLASVGPSHGGELGTERRWAGIIAMLACFLQLMPLITGMVNSRAAEDRRYTRGTFIVPAMLTWVAGLLAWILSSRG